MSTKLCQPETSGSMNCKNGLQLATSFSEVLIKMSFAGLVIKKKARWTIPALGRRGAGTGLVLWGSAGNVFLKCWTLAAHQSWLKAKNLLSQKSFVLFNFAFAFHCNRSKVFMPFGVAHG